MAVIIWWLGLQSVRGVQHYVIKFVSDCCELHVMLSSEKKLILDQNLSLSTIFYNDKIRRSITLCPNQKWFAKDNRYNIM